VPDGFLVKPSNKFSHSYTSRREGTPEEPRKANLPIYSGRRLVTY
jgi:hypothetical protein